MSNNKPSSKTRKNGSSGAKAEGPSLIVPERLGMTRAEVMLLIDKWVVPVLGKAFLEQAKAELEASKKDRDVEGVVQDVVIESKAA